MLFRRERVMIAVLIMLDVAFYAGRSGTISAADIAQRAGLARRGIEPLLQNLSRSGLLESIRGPKGGYRLGRPHRDIGLDEIVRVALAEDSDNEEGPQGDLFTKIVQPYWESLDDLLYSHLKDLTLDTLVKRAEAAGMKRPVSEPITFSI